MTPLSLVPVEPPAHVLGTDGGTERKEVLPGLESAPSGQQCSLIMNRAPPRAKISMQHFADRKPLLRPLEHFSEILLIGNR